MKAILFTNTDYVMIKRFYLYCDIKLVAFGVISTTMDDIKVSPITFHMDSSYLNVHINIKKGIW